MQHSSLQLPERILRTYHRRRQQTKLELKVFPHLRFPLPQFRESWKLFRIIKSKLFSCGFCLNVRANLLGIWISDVPCWKFKKLTFQLNEKRFSSNTECSDRSCVHWKNLESVFGLCFLATQLRSWWNSGNHWAMNVMHITRKVSKEA